MPDQLQLRGGTTAEHTSFTGASKEVTIDTTKKTAVVHDASTAGGNPLMREDGANSALINGSVTEPALAFAAGDADNGIYSPGTDQVAITTNGVERVEWGASEVVFNDGGNNYDFRIEGDTSVNLLLVDASTDRVGIGSASPDNLLHVGSAVGDGIAIGGTVAGTITRETEGLRLTATSTNRNISFVTSGTEAARIDTSGRLLVGASTSTPVGSAAHAIIHTRFGTSNVAISALRENGGAILSLGRVNGTGNEAVTAGQSVGQITFAGADGTDVTRQTAQIYSQTDGTPAENVMPGRLIFATTSSATSANPSERMRIDSSGNVGIAETAPLGQLTIRNTSGTNGFYLTRGASTSIGDVVSCQITVDSSGTRINAYGDALKFRTAATSGTAAERMRIDQAGRLLIGTATTSTTNNSLQIDGGGVARLQYGNIGSGNNSALRISRNDTSVNGDQPLGYLEFGGNDTTDNVDVSLAYIGALAEGAHAAGDNPTRLVFGTTADGASSPTERMRITNDGNFSAFIGSASNAGFRLQGDTAADSGLVVYNNATSTTNGSGVFVVRRDGDVENTNNSYGALSDSKLKENIVDAGSQWDDLKAIQVRKYNFKEETGYGTHTQLGVVAQEVELVSPGLVSESPDKDADGNDLGTVTKSVNYSVLYMKAVKALQEAMERIETLEAKVSALEAN